MLESVRRIIAIPQVPTKAILSASVVLSFAWLLTEDLIHPIVIYLLQAYLAF